MKKILLFALIAAFAFSGCASMTGKSAGETIDDAVITSSVNGKIIADPMLKFLKIDVDTFNGNVTLSGSVANKEAEQRAIELARGTKGVKSVKSNLMIRPMQQKTPQAQ
ncbi:MAG: BON domain-containing protein [Syntrophales bacterium]|nr:BON domain-containing protein [Syntrophales bacterium]MDD5233967.1 BON domain-containing protein [Syntrophales bacterium]MDD5531670.1 BON domain-containing protein [Syntrophales bacterium]HPL62542.1 BON domain-containing protein [Syntrophales bacterium]